MTSRDSEGPRRTPPGPTPQLDAVERLRRQLESRDAKSARRPSRPTAPRSSEPSHDLFGRDSADPYTSTAGWNYGPSARADTYRPTVEPNPADSASTWRITDTPDPATAHAPTRETLDREAADRDRETPDRERETPDRDRETSDRERETSDRGRETSDRDRETSDRDRETSDRGRETSDRDRERESSTGVLESSGADPELSNRDQRSSARGRSDDPAAQNPAPLAGETVGTAVGGGETSASNTPADKLAVARAALAEATAVAAANAAEAAADSDRRGRRGSRAKAAASADQEPRGLEDEDGVEAGARRRGRRGGWNSAAGEPYSGDDASPIPAEPYSGDDASPIPAEPYPDDDETSGREGARGRRGGRRRGAYVERARSDGGDSEDRDGRRGRAGRRRNGAGAESAGSGAPVGGGTEVQAKDVCLRLLTDRARSRFELAERLADKGFNAEVAKRALDRLTEVGLIDDAAFAQQWVHSRHTYSGKGKKVLAEELRRKGIAPEHAEPALEAVTAADELARAADLVRRKASTLSPDLDRDKAVRRMVAMLARKGYSPATAFEVVRAELPPSPAPRREASPAASPAPGGATSAPARRESPSDDAESAAELVRAKLRTLSPNLDREATTRRLVGLLARRGFTAATAYTVVTAELNAATPDADDSDRSNPARTGTAPTPPRHSEPASAPPPAPAEDDEQARAAELVRAKLRTLPRNLDPAKATQRLVGLLARRGFSPATAYSVVKAELADAGTAAD